MQQKKVHFTALVILPTEQSFWSIVQSLRVQYDQVVDRWPPHINLLYPFIAPEQFEEGSHRIFEILRSVEPFEITFKGIDFFQHAKKCVGFLSPTENEKIEQLFQKCLEAFPFCNDTIETHGCYRSHLTLGQFKNPREVQKFQKATNIGEDLKIEVKEVFFISRTDKDAPMIINYRIPLNGIGSIQELVFGCGKQNHDFINLTIGSPERHNCELLLQQQSIGKEKNMNTQEECKESKLSDGFLKSADNEQKIENLKSEFTSIDGSTLEGGGQILRVSLSLSAVCGLPIMVHSIRANRPKQGLMAQQLSCVNLIGELCSAEIQQAVIGSKTVYFKPNDIRAGLFEANIGTAGSITLLIQSIIPCAIFAPSEVQILMRGGTDVNFSPPIDSVIHVLRPLISTMGINTEFHVKKRGYFPYGHGEVLCKFSPCRSIERIELVEQGLPTSVEIYIAGKVVNPEQVINFITNKLQRYLQDEFDSFWISGVQFTSQTDIETLAIKETKNSKGKNKQQSTLNIEVVMKTSTGCVLGTNILYERNNDQIISNATCMDLISQLVRDLKVMIQCQCCIDWRLSDQLIVFMALAKGKSRILVPPVSLLRSQHLPTIIEIVKQLTNATFTISSVMAPGATFPEPCQLIECQGINYESALFI